MNRKKFIKALSFGAGGIALPAHSIIENCPIKIYDNYLTGLMYYDFEKVKTFIKEGDPLELVREKKNKYDTFSIAVYFQEKKLGYLPAYENIVLANLLDAGSELNAFVSKFNPKADIFTTLAVEVFAQLILPSDKLIQLIRNERRADDVSDLYRQGETVAKSTLAKKCNAR